MGDNTPENTQSGDDTGRGYLQTQLTRSVRRINMPL